MFYFICNVVIFCMNYKSLYYIVGLWFYLNNKMMGFFRLNKIFYLCKFIFYILCIFLEDDCLYVEVDVFVKIYILKYIIFKYISGLWVWYKFI